MSEYLYSMGISPIANKLSKILSFYDREVPNIIAINIATIADSCAGKQEVVEAIKMPQNSVERADTLIVNSTKVELDLLISQICHTLEHNKHVVDPVVLVYGCKYKNKAGSKLFREAPPSKVHIQNAINRLCAELPDQPVSRKEKGVEVIVLPELKGYSHIELTTYIEALDTIHNVLMLTHHPYDLHINYPVKLLQRYTGNVFKYSELGNYMFSNPQIPFNIMTHHLFGDKHDLVPLLKAKKKKEAIKFIEDNNLALMQYAEFKKTMLSKGYAVPNIY